MEYIILLILVFLQKRLSYGSTPPAFFPLLIAVKRD